MTDDVRLAPLPPREALEYFRSKGYAPALQRFDYRDFWREEHARGFVVAKAMRDDVLKTIRTAVDGALAEGRTLDQFRDELAPQLRSMGWWGKSIERDPATGELREVQLGSMRRLKVIFDTNMRTAYAAGHWARLQRTKDFLPYLEYRQLQRETARDEHKPFHGLILPIDHPIWRLIFPPNGWFCGCSVRPLNDRMLKREGKRLSTDAEVAALDLTRYTNPRTGEQIEVPEGLDPSFASNPGLTWLDIDDRHAETELSLPKTHSGTDRGLVKEASALALRTKRANLIGYNLNESPDAPPLDMVQSPTEDEGAAPISPNLARALADNTQSLVFVRAHPAGLSDALADLPRLTSATSLRQVVLTAPDGLVHRIERSQTALPATFDLSGFPATARAVLHAEMPELAARQIEELTAHAVLSALSEQGVITYAAAPSGRLGDLIFGAARAIAEIARLLAADL